jgi:hypothetical protein
VEHPSTSTTVGAMGKNNKIYKENDAGLRKRSEYL